MNIRIPLACLAILTAIPLTASDLYVSLAVGKNKNGGGLGVFHIEFPAQAPDIK